MQRLPQQWEVTRSTEEVVVDDEKSLQEYVSQIMPTSLRELFQINQKDLLWAAKWMPVQPGSQYLKCLAV